MIFHILGLTDSVNSNNNTLITPWSFIHFLSGGTLFAFIRYINNNFSLKINQFQFMIIVHTIYEMKDFYKSYILKENTSYWSDNTLFNSFGDTLCAIIGFYFYKYYIFIGKNNRRNSYIILIIILFINISFANIFSKLKMD